jgi:hypothetical protein
VESEPGIERSSLVIRPAALAKTMIAAARTIQTSSVHFAWRMFHFWKR